MTKRTTPADAAAFVEAARDGDIATIGEFIDKGVAVDSLSKGLTALYAAAEKGHAVVVRTLLAAGAHPNTLMTSREAGVKFRSALNIAVASGHLAVIEDLLASGADPRIIDAGRRTAAHLLMHFGRRFFHGADVTNGLLKQMSAKGVDLNQGDNEGYTALHRAVVADVPVSVLTAMLQMGADPLRVAHDGNTPFHLSCLGGRVEAFQTFLDFGVSVNAANGFGQRPLHIYNMGQSADSIYAAGPDLEARDHHGRTPLAYRLDEAEHGEPGSEAMRLLQAGADVDAQDYSGVTPRQVIGQRKLGPLQSFLAASQARDAMALVAGAKRNDPPAGP